MFSHMLGRCFQEKGGSHVPCSLTLSGAGSLGRLYELSAFLGPNGENVYVTLFDKTFWFQVGTLSLPRVINFKFPLQPHQKYDITQYEELGFS